MINIIGISGYKQSGKDTVAKIIRYIIGQDSGHFKDVTLEEFLNSKDFEYEINSGWVVKKFAQKLKEIVSLYTGIPLHELELESIKQQYWIPSSSNVLSNESCIEHNIKMINTSDEWNNSVNLDEFENCGILIRLILQYEGTEIGRTMRGKNSWVNATFSDYKPLSYSDHSGWIYPNWIITDLRFENEANKIKSLGGVIIRVEKEKDFYYTDNKIKVYCSEINHNNVDRTELSIIKHDAHISEVALLDYQFDYYIRNTGTLEDLYNSTKQILKLLKII